MSSQSASQFPPAPWSPVAIRLMQGVIYQDENLEHWELLLRSQSPLEEFFSKIGLQLLIDHHDAMAYLKQFDEEEHESVQASLPRLFRRAPLNYETTLLCVLLRDELRLFEEREVNDERCVVPQSELLITWQSFFPDDCDQVKLNRSLSSTLRKLEDLKFVRLFEKEPPTWEVRRIIKAKLPLSDLEQLRKSLTAEVLARGNRSTSTATAPINNHVTTQ